MVQLSAAAACDVPPLRVIVTICPETPVLKDPSIVEQVLEPAPTPVRSKPLPNVTLIKPFAGMASAVIKATVAVPVVAERVLGRVILVDVKRPFVMVSAVTAASISISSPAAVLVAML